MNTHVGDKVVLITGASSGIGEATGTKFAVIAISECMRLENQDVRVTVVIGEHTRLGPSRV